MRAAISLADNPGTANLALWAKSVLFSETVGTVRQAAENFNAPERVLRAINAPHMTTDSDLTGLTDTLQILTSFAPLLRNASAFFRLLENGMVKVPLRQRLTWLTGSASIGIVNEAEAIKVSRMISDNVTIDPVRAAGIVVLSDEFMKFLSAGGEAFLSMELRRAITASVDAGFFSLITDGSTPTQAASGSTESAALADVYALFEAVELTAESKPLIVMSPDVGRRAATLSGAGGRAFPNMGPTGGDMCGVPAMVTDALAAGTLGLVDAAGLAGDALGINIQSARHANVQLNDTPDSPATASTTLINLWQRNLVGLMPEVFFGVERLRDNAYATITGVQWNASGNSPT
ncbi:phage major capsid protein [Mesorhizobium sp.]|uniref:phage major capsid protein n=1 Tax=Mesorhizobium sp. TaxID=1871066 RepID=UPI000FE45390|nr:phage major capsid protein [Mesorhizobium sp.]RWN28892.1 MAG: hypothetical protein EOR95_22945 [Mesorhizobium sp.]